MSQNRNHPNVKLDDTFNVAGFGVIKLHGPSNSGIVDQKEYLKPFIDLLGKRIQLFRFGHVELEKVRIHPISLLDLLVHNRQILPGQTDKQRIDVFLRKLQGKRLAQTLAGSGDQGVLILAYCVHSELGVGLSGEDSYFQFKEETESSKTICVRTCLDTL